MAKNLFNRYIRLVDTIVLKTFTTFAKSFKYNDKFIYP
jgi:hypothetical protein